MEATAVLPYSAPIVEVCCQILSSPTIMNCTCDLRVTAQLPVMDMKLSGPHPPLAVVELFMETEAPSPAPAIRALTQTTLTVNGPSLLLLEDSSPSTFTSSVLMILETVSRTILYSMMDQMLILPPLDHIAAQTLT